MASFSVTVYPVKIEEHPNADLLECAVIGEYRSVVKKGQFQDGDLAAYIPEGSLVPQHVLAELGLEGRLAGPEQNRVKAIKLRGILSQGLCYPARPGWSAGDNVAEELGITKYIPLVPVHMTGQVEPLGKEFIQRYDVEPYRKYPDLLTEGEEVVMTEKVHGTCTILGVFPGPVETIAGVREWFVASKGLADQGLAFKDNDANAENLYVRIVKKFSLPNKAMSLVRSYGEQVTLFGETYGRKVQDLQYGQTDQAYALFDIYVGQPGQGRFLDHDELFSAAAELEIPTVRLLYRGPFSQAKLYEMAEGPETYSGTEAHMREGVVVRPVKESTRLTQYGSAPHEERVVLKHVGEGYLLRKDATEYE